MSNSMHPLVSALMQELPAQGEPWPRATRQKWIAAATSVFDLVYPSDVVADTQPRKLREVKTTKNQEFILDALRAKGAEEDWVEVSLTELAQAAGVSLGSTSPFLDGLEKQGALEIMRAPPGKGEKNKYRIRGEQ